MPRDRFGFPLDARRHIKSLVHNVVSSLRAKHRVTVFAATYPSPIQDEVLGALGVKTFFLADPTTSTQASTFASGLSIVDTDHGNYDRVISTRFDLAYCRPASDWDIRRPETGIYFPWREYEYYWNLNHRVGDAIHVIDREFLSAFRSTLLANNSKADLHDLYDLLRPTTDRLYFIVDGFYDSNSLFCNRECKNPLYRIANRPRLPFPQPYRPRVRPPTSWRRLMELKLVDLAIRAVAKCARLVLQQR